MRRRDFIGVAAMGAVGAGLPSPLGAEPPPPDRARGVAQEDPRIRQIGRLIEAKMAEYRVPGVALGILKDRTLTMGGFGLTNIENPQPVTQDTVFPIMSITKTVVTLAVMRLVEQGRIALDAPVRQYLPGFRIADEDVSRTVTIRHLLTHTPGWEGEVDVVDRGDLSLVDYTEAMAHLPKLADPGAVWGYNNSAFAVAGRILEVVTNSSIHGALTGLVLDPLGLERAFTRTGTAMTYRFAAPHTELQGRTVVIRPYSLPPNTPAAGVAMSLASLMSYARFHLGNGSGPTGAPVLRRASLDLMRTPQVVKRPTTDEMGVGWHLRRLGGVQTCVHCGTGPGHSVHLQLVPERNLAFALLTNHWMGWRLTSDVEREILSLYEDLALAPNQPIGAHRGASEDMTHHATPLSPPPRLEEYVGVYERPPVVPVTVSVAPDERLQILGVLASPMPLAFWGPDLAYVDRDDYANRGIPVEFIRDAAGEVRWMRFDGRIARKSRDTLADE